jgi:NarL family two-component system response regulator LiaR
VSEQITEQVTVLIVDDHAVVRKGVRGYLEAQPDIAIAGEAASGEEAVRLAADHRPDVILMDLVMPGMNGVAATRRVRQVSPDSQVIVLTS